MGGIEALDLLRSAMIWMVLLPFLCGVIQVIKSLCLAAPAHGDDARSVG